MKVFKTIFLAILCGMCSIANAASLDVSYGCWTLTMSSSNKLTIEKGGVVLFKNVFVKAKNGSDTELNSNDYPSVVLNEEAVNDGFGSGKKFTYTYSGATGKENIEQSFYIYDDKDFMITEASIVAVSGTTTSNYIAPIYTTSNSTASFLPSTGGDNRMLDMPFDNDGWIGYSAQPFSIGQTITSSEVSCFYDVVGRKGLCIGSIEHNTWKTGITAKLSNSNKLQSLQVFSGYTADETCDTDRDSDGNELNTVMRHGYVTGSKVRSAKIFVGYYDDWRNGLEALGDATAVLKPKLKWNGGTIFAWQSWGGMATKVNYEGVMDVGTFFYEQLMPNHFHNENNTCYMVLDSYWSNLSDTQLALFVEQCKKYGQHPGIYTTPFSYWSGAEYAKTQKVTGTDYVYDDLILRGNGQLRKISAYALDPTHPGTLEMNRQKFQKFKDLGFEYVKLDFLNNGTMEADSYYEKSITTGMQAYTYGMTKILEMADGMFIDLSIAPVFPAMGHARRISCDAWGELVFSQYSLNSINLGWWLDRVYEYNDPDHLVLQRSEDDAAARIRYSCGAITGTVLLGDNYSLTGSYVGKQEYRDRALRIATNEEINKVARLGRSFRPVEGSLSFNNFKLYSKYYDVDNEFVLDTNDALYYVCFNYKTDNALSQTVAFERIGISSTDVGKITELWTGSTVSFDGDDFVANVPAGDVCFYRIDKKTASVNSLVDNGDNIDVQVESGSIVISSGREIKSVAIYSVNGMACGTYHVNTNSLRIPNSSLSKGVYIVHIKLLSGKTISKKIIV